MREVEGVWLRRTYPWVIFLSAFLTFVVQPMEGKALLPWFGGASAVWATGLLFFTGFLFLGYLYVYLLIRFGGKREILIHRAVVALTIGATLLPLLFQRSFHSDLNWTTGNGMPPSLQVLLALLLSVGPPYFLLATTSPLLQYWWGKAGTGEPYKLYALSNVGSLLALLAYPLAIEPLLSLPTQNVVWILLFLIYIGLYLYATELAIRAGRRMGPHGEMEGAQTRIHDGDGVTDARLSKKLRHSRKSRETTVAERLGVQERADGTVRWMDFLAWIGCAALPSFLLVSVTTQITQVVAPVPMLWTIPLALYLLSFIFAFRGVGGSLLSLVFLLAATALVFWAGAGDRLVRAEVQVLAALLLLFTSGVVFHARLYAMRPALAQLPLFFLLLSLGGVIGTLGASLLPPLLFSDLLEYPLGVALAAGIGGGLLIASLLRGRVPQVWIATVQVACLLLAGFGFVEGIPQGTSNRLAHSRNFYGTAMVSLEGDQVVLSHGMTRHGTQFSDGDREQIPTAYYSPTSGVGRAAVYLAGKEGGEPVRFGLVGLGAGTLAAYCRPGDSFVFYELDPRITSLARRFFTYLRMCPGVVVRHGDARILLESEREAGSFGRYDLIAVDAFSDDAVPMHLLTLEAFHLYLDHLAPDGILAIHTSNVYIELAPVVIRIAEELGWAARTIRDWEQVTPGAAGSDWVLLAEDPEVFQAPHFSNAVVYHPTIQAPLWTDTHSSILPLLRGYRMLVSLWGS